MERGHPPTPGDTNIKAAVRDRDAHWRTEVLKQPPVQRDAENVGQLDIAGGRGRGAAALENDLAASSKVKYASFT